MIASHFVHFTNGKTKVGKNSRECKFDNF